MDEVLAQFESLQEEKEELEQKYSETKSAAIARTAQVAALENHRKSLKMQVEGQT